MRTKAANISSFEDPLVEKGLDTMKQADLMKSTDQDIDSPALIDRETPPNDIIDVNKNS